MFSQSKPTLLAFVLLALGGLLLCQPAQADLIHLKSGGELRGLIPSGKGATTGKEVTITTLTGTVVTVAQEQIQFITRRPLKIEEYETRAQRTPDTIDAQWALAEWCREQNLKTQRDEHLERILQLDPDHEKAHYGLKHTLVNGEWMSREERLTSQGYVFHKGRWITPQELELAEKTAEEREREETWFQQVHLWKNWLTGTHAARSRDALKNFRDLKDPDAVPALVKNFQDEESKQLRAMYISVLDNIPGPKPVPALVKQSLHDVNYELRYEALNAINPEQYEAATQLYIRELRHDLNAIVCRAGKALERMADDRVVPQLIEALVTTHRYRIPIPDSGGMSFRSDGSGLSNGSGTVLPPDVELALRSGQLPGVIINNASNQLQRQPKMVTVNLDEQNREVLQALQKITGQNFGYNERTWLLWHNAQKNGAGNLPALP
jgi:hypothetical protein